MVFRICCGVTDFFSLQTPDQELHPLAPTLTNKYFLLAGLSLLDVTRETHYVTRWIFTVTTNTDDTTEFNGTEPIILLYIEPQIRKSRVKPAACTQVSPQVTPGLLKLFHDLLTHSSFLD